MKYVLLFLSVMMLYICTGAAQNIAEEKPPTWDFAQKGRILFYDVDVNNARCAISPNSRLSLAGNPTSNAPIVGVESDDPLCSIGGLEKLRLGCIVLGNSTASVCAALQRLHGYSFAELIVDYTLNPAIAAELGKSAPNVSTLGIKVHEDSSSSLDLLKKLPKLTDVSLSFIGEMRSLAWLAGLPSLERLSLGIDKLPDGFIRVLSECANLRDLSLNCESIPDNEIEALGLLKGLSALELNSWQISKCSFNSINTLENLVSLKTTLNIFGDDLASLQCPSHLRELVIAGDVFPADILAALLSKQPDLTSLGINGAVDGDLAALLGCVRSLALERVSLAFGRDEVVRMFLEKETLTSLFLSFYTIQAEDAALIEKMNLRALYIAKCGLEIESLDLTNSAAIQILAFHDNTKMIPSAISPNHRISYLSVRHSDIGKVELDCMAQICSADIIRLDFDKVSYIALDPLEQIAKYAKSMLLRGIVEPHDVCLGTKREANEPLLVFAPIMAVRPTADALAECAKRGVYIYPGTDVEGEYYVTRTVARICRRVTESLSKAPPSVGERLITVPGAKKEYVEFWTSLPVEYALQCMVDTTEDGNKRILFAAMFGCKSEDGYIVFIGCEGMLCWRAVITSEEWHKFRAAESFVLDWKHTDPLHRLGLSNAVPVSGEDMLR